MTLDQFLSRLKNVKKNHDGTFAAQCPAHDDRVSSLSVRAGSRVNIIAFCHAGCDFRSIIRAAEFGVRR